MPPEHDDEWLTLEEVAKKLRVHKRTVRRMIADGLFPGPQHPTPGASLWSAFDMETYRRWVSLGPRLRRRKPRAAADAKPDPPPKKAGDRKGTGE